MHGHPKAALHGEEVIQPASGHHDPDQRIHLTQSTVPTALLEGLGIGIAKSIGHALIEVVDVAAAELDDVDIDEQDVVGVLAHVGFDRRRHFLQVIGEVRFFENLLEAVLGIQDQLPVVVEQVLEDGFL